MRNCFGSCLHQKSEHHVSFTCEQGAPHANASIPVLRLPIWESNSRQPAQLVLGSFFWKSALFLQLTQHNLSLFLSCPTLEELGMYTAAKGWAAMWPEGVHGREGRSEDEALLTKRGDTRKKGGELMEHTGTESKGN